MSLQDTLPNQRRGRAWTETAGMGDAPGKGKGKGKGKSSGKGNSAKGAGGSYKRVVTLQPNAKRNHKKLTAFSAARSPKCYTTTSSTTTSKDRADNGGSKPLSANNTTTSFPSPKSSKSSYHRRNTDIDRLEAEITAFAEQLDGA